MEMPHAFQMAVKAPAIHQDGVGPPGRDLGIERRVDQSPEMMRSRIGRHIWHKPVFISVQQRDIPFDPLLEIRIVFGAGTRLLPGIEHTGMDSRTSSEQLEPGSIILDRMGSHDRKPLFRPAHETPFFSSQYSSTTNSQISDQRTSLSSAR